MRRENETKKKRKEEEEGERTRKGGEKRGRKDALRLLFAHATCPLRRSKRPPHLERSAAVQDAGLELRHLNQELASNCPRRRLQITDEIGDWLNQSYELWESISVRLKWEGLPLVVPVVHFQGRP